jgi:hypothetical protein
MPTRITFALLNKSGGSVQQVILTATRPIAEFRSQGDGKRNSCISSPD